MSSPSIDNVRRFYLLKHFAELDSGVDGVGVWRSKQDAIPGTALSVGFPSRGSLVALGYSTVEDLTGADTKELEKRGFSSTQSAAILAALPTEV